MRFAVAEQQQVAGLLACRWKERDCSRDLVSHPATSARAKRAPGVEKLDGRTSFAMTADATELLLYMLKGAPTVSMERDERHVRPAAHSPWLATARKTNTIRSLSS